MEAHSPTVRQWNFPKICREITELKKPAKRPYSPSGEKSLSMTGIIFLPYRTVLFTKPSLYQEGSSCLLWWLLWLRSEERRVGKECRGRRAQEEEKEKKDEEEKQR